MHLMSPPNVQIFLEQQLFSVTILNTTVCVKDEANILKPFSFNHRSILIHTPLAHRDRRSH